jgi:type IV secretion system protein VirD4
MSMTPPPDGSSGSEADVEAARQAADGQSSGQTDVASKKTAPVVQAVIAEERRQMEMDFVGDKPSDGLARAEADAQLRTALDDLDDLRSTMANRSEAGHVEQL